MKSEPPRHSLMSAPQRADGPLPSGSLIETVLDCPERCYRPITGSLPDTALIPLTPDGRVAGWSSAGERILGYAEGEIIGQPVARLFPPAAEQAMPQEELERAAAGGQTSYLG